MEKLEIEVTFYVSGFQRLRQRLVDLDIFEALRQAEGLVFSDVTIDAFAAVDVSFAPYRHRFDSGRRKMMTIFAKADRGNSTLPSVSEKSGHACPGFSD